MAITSTAGQRDKFETNRGGAPLFRSVQFKYAVTYLLVIGAVLLLLNTYPLIMAQDMVFKSKETAMKSQALTVSAALGVTEALTADGVEQVMLLLEEMGATRILVTDPSGLILYDTSEIDNRLYDYALLGEVAAALDGVDVFRSEYRDGAFRSRAASPVLYQGSVLGVVYLYEADAEQGSLMLSIQSNLRYISLIVCVVAVLLAWVLSMALTRNIGSLLGAIRRVREGEYTHRVTPRGGDELAQLAQEFNQLTGRLQTTEEVRRRFVSDASHELKTPLASIRLLSDSILHTGDMDMDTAREFVSDIGEEAERLTRITEKLLTLTKLDSAAVPPLGPVALEPVVDKVTHMLLPLAQAVGVTLEKELEPGCDLLATGDDLYQILFNLMENAIKYNLPGGRVEVSARRRSGWVTLEVADTGVGIPEEDRERVFQRFYRVDKARSRAAGGTGLGLSIVHDMVKGLGGKVAALPRTDGPGARLVVELQACPQAEGKEDGQNGQR